MDENEISPIDPDQPAIIMSAGETVTHGMLNKRANKLARLLQSRDLKPGDHIALMLENNIRYFEICRAASISGLYFTPINWHLTVEEAAYIVDDCGAKALFGSEMLKDLVEQAAAAAPNVETRLMVDGASQSFVNYEKAAEGVSDGPLDEEHAGSIMFYSSGTTGRPKGIKRALPTEPPGAISPLAMLMQVVWGFGPDTRYLVPAPLYHAAPLGWSLAALQLGGAAVVMDRFDPENCLAMIEEHKITHAQFVPTMFIRMLKLPEETRKKYDVSSLEFVIHAAAPCPIDVKEQMIEWWGPIINEYYAGSEGNGFVASTSEEWLNHRGTVGKSMGAPIHIVGENGEAMPTGEAGTIYFGESPVFEYHNDPDKTAEAFNDKGWSTLGDVGYLDEEGYLYLTDRKSHMIISGGVNIYPQETENALSVHPAVLDVAVIGVPNAEMGEEVKAVVELVEGQQASKSLEEDLIAYCKERIAHFKCPKSVDFVDELPRLPNGKLLKRRLRDKYWPD
jgi:acyl-CoA synthetase (AMP-forming)/AMP-acid ligase II